MTPSYRDRSRPGAGAAVLRPFRGSSVYRSEPRIERDLSNWSPTAMTPETPRNEQAPTTRELGIELLALDLASCTRCTGTLTNIERAIEAVRPVAAAMGSTLALRKLVVASEQQALELRFVSSPTIRVDGREIVFETLESSCGSCSELCGCSEGTDCRVWSYQGVEHEEAPVGLVVEALLRALVGGGGSPSAPARASEPFAVPENLRRFFAGKRAKSAAPETAGASACCPPSELATCCAPEEKPGCCAPATNSCGCN
jgi:hypothetical protein